MKKVFLWVWLFVAAAGLQSCFTVKPVEFRSVDHLQFRNLSAVPEFSADVNLYNPNTVGAKLKEFSLEFYLGNVQMAVLQLDDASRVPSRQDFTLPVSGFTSVSQMAQFVPKGLNSYLKGADLPVTVSGSVTVKKFVFSKTFPFHYEDSISTADILIR